MCCPPYACCASLLTLWLTLYLSLQAVVGKVHEIMSRQMHIATDLNQPLSGGSLLAVCACLSIMRSLDTNLSDYVVKFLVPLVKLLNRFAREHASSGGALLAPFRAPASARCCDDFYLEVGRRTCRHDPLRLLQGCTGRV